MLKKYIPAIALAMLAAALAIGTLFLHQSLSEVPTDVVQRDAVVATLDRELADLEEELVQVQAENERLAGQLSELEKERAEAQAGLEEISTQAERLSGLVGAWTAINADAQTLAAQTADASCFGYVLPPAYDLNALRYLQAGNNVYGLANSWLGKLMADGMEINTRTDVSAWTMLINEITEEVNDAIQSAQNAMSSYYAYGGIVDSLLPEELKGDQLVAGMKLYELLYTGEDAQMEARRIEMVHALNTAAATLDAYRPVFEFYLSDSTERDNYLSMLDRNSTSLQAVADQYKTGAEGEALTEAEALAVRQAAARNYGRVVQFFYGSDLWLDHSLSEAMVTSTTHKITTAKRAGQYIYIRDEKDRIPAYYIYDRNGLPVYFSRGEDEVVFEDGQAIWSTYDETATHRITLLAGLLFEKGYDVRKEYAGYAVY